MTNRSSLFPPAPAEIATYLSGARNDKKKEPGNDKKKWAALSYCDNNVASFWSTSEIVSVGKVHINSAFRAPQSKLLS